MKKQKRGFAVMSDAQVHEIVTLGGLAVFHKYGRKYMRRIGARGGKQSGENRHERAQDARISSLEPSRGRSR